VRYCKENGFKAKKNKTFRADIKKYCEHKQRRKDNKREWYYKFNDELSLNSNQVMMIWMN
jgi:hypothetical protein